MKSLPQSGPGSVADSENPPENCGLQTGNFGWTEKAKRPQTVYSI